MSAFKIRPGRLEGYVEVLFDEKPEAAVTTELKAAKFRFTCSEDEPRWYGKESALPARYKTAPRIARRDDNGDGTETLTAPDGVKLSIKPLIKKANSKLDALAAIKKLNGFIGKNQLHCITDGMRGEEKQAFFDDVCRLAAIVNAMPHTYQTEGQGDKAIVHLHYFKGGCDWYIVEKDKESEQHQAFGYANLGDPDNAETGYISLVEILDLGVELDFHFKPRPLSEVKAKRSGDEPLPPPEPEPNTEPPVLPTVPDSPELFALNDLPFKLANGFSGNILPADSKYITDGRTLIVKELISKKLAKQLMAIKPDKKVNILEKAVEQVLKMAIDDCLTNAEFVFALKPDSIGFSTPVEIKLVACLKPETGDPQLFDAHRANLLLHLQCDEIKNCSTKENKPVVAFKEGEPMAVLMPLLSELSPSEKDTLKSLFEKAKGKPDKKATPAPAKDFLSEHVTIVHVGAPKSWKIGVKTSRSETKWGEIAMRYPTYEAAEKAARDLTARWMAVVDWTVLESDEAPNAEHIPGIVDVKESAVSIGKSLNWGPKNVTPITDGISLAERFARIRKAAMGQ